MVSICPPAYVRYYYVLPWSTSIIDYMQQVLLKEQSPCNKVAHKSAPMTLISEGGKAHEKQRRRFSTPEEGQHKVWKKSDLSFFAGGKRGRPSKSCFLGSHTWSVPSWDRLECPSGHVSYKTANQLCAAGVQWTLMVPLCFLRSSCHHLPLHKTGKVIFGFQELPWLWLLFTLCSWETK